jgi:hypothetical protein
MSNDVPSTQGDPLFSRVLETMAGLGLKVRGQWVHSGMFSGVVTTGKNSLYRLDFSIGESGAYTINILPVDPASNRLVGHWLDLDPSNPESLEDFESFLRAVLVKIGRLPKREFPTDSALLSWLSDAAKPYAGPPPCRDGMRLRHDASALLASPFERDSVLALVRDAARLDANPANKGHVVDREFGYAVRHARDVVSGRLSRFMDNISAESHLGFLFDGTPRPSEASPGSDESSDGEASSPTP